MRMGKCSCGAKWKCNYPHGKKSSGIKVTQIEHAKWCDFK